MVAQHLKEWVLLSYRMPREPSTPRIAVWRRLKELGVAQVGDGLVALPQKGDAQEQLEWVAQRVHDADGEAIVWLARPTATQEVRRLADQIRADRAEEYDAVLDEIGRAEDPVDPRTIARWRRTLRRIRRRDPFGSDRGDVTRAALSDLLGRSRMAEEAR